MVNTYFSLLNLICSFAQLIISYLNYKSSKMPEKGESHEKVESPVNSKSPVNT